jgi:hypothetical protein
MVRKAGSGCIYRRMKRSRFRKFREGQKEVMKKRMIIMFLTMNPKDDNGRETKPSAI